MALKQEFATQIQAQIDVWQSQIKEHQERLGKAGAAASAEYEKTMATLKENAEEGAALLQRVREANERAWSDKQSATQMHSLNCRKDGAKPSAASCEAGRLD
jgi:hypothetical protein